MKNEIVYEEHIYFIIQFIQKTSFSIMIKRSNNHQTSVIREGKHIFPNKIFAIEKVISQIE